MRKLLAGIQRASAACGLPSNSSAAADLARGGQRQGQAAAGLQSLTQRAQQTHEVRRARRSRPTPQP